MSESVQRREPRQPGELNSLLLIAGIIVGSIVLLVVSLVAFFGVFNIPNEGIVAGIVLILVNEGIVASIVLILVAAIPGNLIGLLVFRRFKKKASSRTNLILVPAFSGIVGGVVIAGILFSCFAVWYFATHCC
jgi:ABC-type cobalamin transport system permease subunit